MPKLKMNKLQKIEFLKEKFPDFYKAIEEAKLACDVLYEELDVLCDKIDSIHEKLEEVEDLKRDISSDL